MENSSKIEYEVALKSSVIVIPAYKPTEVLNIIIEKLYSHDFPVIVVDDGSGEEYESIFKYASMFAKVLKHDVNMGKGEALKTAYRYIRDDYLDYKAVITADADGQHSIEDIEKIHRLLVQKERNKEDNEIILGSRAFTGKVPLKSRFGNSFTRMTFANATKVKVNDTQTGLRGFFTTMLDKMINVSGSRYEYELNVLMWAVRNNIRIIEEPIETIYNIEDNQSHFRPIRDSLIIYSNIIKFALSSFTSFIVDFTLVLLFDRLIAYTGATKALIASVIVARIISSIYNYSVNKLLVFKYKENTGNTLVKYFSLAGIILVLNITLMYVLNIVIGIKLVVAKIIVETILFVSSYLVQSRLIFLKKGKEGNEISAN